MQSSIRAPRFRECRAKPATYRCLLRGARTERTWLGRRSRRGTTHLTKSIGLPAATPSGGRCRPGGAVNRDVLIDWVGASAPRRGDGVGDVAAIVDRRLRAGLYSIWDDGAPVALAGHSDVVAGVVRVGPVYTPPDCRGRGPRVRGS